MSHLITFMSTENFAPEDLLDQIYDKLDTLRAANVAAQVLNPIPPREFVAYCVNKFRGKESNPNDAPSITDAHICEFYEIIDQLNVKLQRVLVVVLPRFMSDIVKLRVIKTLFACGFKTDAIRKLYATTIAAYTQLPQPRKVDKLLHKIATFA